MDSWAGPWGLPFLEEQQAEVLLPGFWAACGSGLGAEQGRVRVGPVCTQLGAWPVAGLFGGHLISSLLLPPGPASADGVLPPEDLHRGALSRNADLPAVTCRAPRSSSQLSLEASWTKRHGSEGLQGACISSWRRAGRQEGQQLVRSPAGLSLGRGSRCERRVAPGNRGRLGPEPAGWVLLRGRWLRRRAPGPVRRGEERTISSVPRGDGFNCDVELI